VATKPKRDYYQVLGVDRGADDKAIKTAYRKLARKHHPDVNPGDNDSETRFKEIGEAYSVLSDPEKRKKYDRFGPDFEKYVSASGGAGSGTYTSTPGSVGNFNFGGENFDSVLEQLFGRANVGRTRVRTTVPRKGADLEEPIQISLEDAFNGTTVTLQIRDTQTGEIRKVEVKIPAGAAEGLRVRVAGKGDPGYSGGTPGDLYLIVTIKPNPLFEREGDDLRTRVPTPLYTAVLGGEVLVPTPKGTHLALKVPAETNNGTRMRLTGQGMPRLNGSGRGDLYAEISVQVPKGLSEKERELFEELARERGQAKTGSTTSASSASA